MNFFGEPKAPASPSNLEFDPAVETVRVVAPEHWSELIAWIDPHKDPQQVESTLAELQRRNQLQPHCPMPLETIIGSQRVAAAYMVLLGARVAALGGVRAIDNHLTSATHLMSQLVDQVRAAGVVQIQAILNSAESIATEIVSQAGFVPVAKLQQMTLMVPAKPRSPELLQLPADYYWLKAQEVPRAQLVQLIAHTFIETLDCPDLNGLRSPEDVLDGFLDGQTLESREHWWLIKHDAKLVGCTLVNPLPDKAAELVYLGLGPTSRGRGLGRILLERAVNCATSLQAEVFLAAVDSANWPATRLYFQAGFQETARVQAWFHRPADETANHNCFLC